MERTECEFVAVGGRIMEMVFLWLYLPLLADQCLLVSVIWNAYRADLHD